MRLQYEKPEYIVKENHKVVVCILKCRFRDYTVLLRGNPALVTLFAEHDIDVYSGEFTIKSISRCDYVDIFNESFGKRLAYKRAKLKAYKRFTTIYKKIITHLRAELIKHEILSERSECKADTLTADINLLINL